MRRAVALLSLGRYPAQHKLSISNPEAFWANAEKENSIVWDKPYTTVLERGNDPFFKWFAGGSLNVCRNAVDVHVESGNGSKLALIYDSPNTGIKQKFTYAELLDEVQRFASVLLRHGVGPGDCVIIYMPMIPEAVTAMLACARIGAIHSVVFGGFAPLELAKRINDCTPKVIVTASCGFLDTKRHVAYKPLVDESLRLAKHSPNVVLVKQRAPVTASMGAKDLDWDVEMARSRPCTPISVDSNAPLYILYTSGTTGDPKGILRDSAGYVVALKWSMQNIYGTNSNSVFWAASDIGWVVGHSYIVYAPLLCGMTTVLFDGKPVGTPDAGTFWRVLEEHNVDVMFSAPTAFRAIRKEDPSGKLLQRHNLKNLRGLFLAGERADPETVHWLQQAVKPFGTSVFDHYWQTESGWPILAPCVGLTGGHSSFPVRVGSAGLPVPGYDFRLINEDGQFVDNPKTDGSEIYDLLVRLPLPPGTLPTLYKNDTRFITAYLTPDMKYYRTGDAGFVDDEGNYFVMARTDDVINTAGHRLSTSALEEIVQGHLAVAETAVFGVNDSLKGQIPVACCVLKDGVTDSPSTISNEVVRLVRQHFGAIACLSTCHIVEKLPKTRSGKILRKEMANIANGKPYRTPGTIEDPTVLPYLETVFRK